MELRVHNDVKAIKCPTGLIPCYDDLAKLFKQVLKKDYTKEDYVKQFTIRVPENLAKKHIIRKIFLTIYLWFMKLWQKHGNYLKKLRLNTVITFHRLT